MTTQQQPLTQEKALEYWTELQRLVSVGAFEERHQEHYETGTWPEDGVEESIFNLENWAARQRLEFTWNADSQKWSLTLIEQGPDDVENERTR